MNRSFIMKFTLTSIVLFGIAIATTVIFDPFYYYHAPIGSLKEVLEERDYEVIGTIRNFEYDALLMGTSTAENYDNTQFNEEFDCTTIKAVRANGSTADILYYLDRAYEEREVDKVFYSIDFNSLKTKYEDTTANMDSWFLINRNPFDDTKYLLNKDVLLKKIPIQLAFSFALDYNEGESYHWYESKTFAQDACLSHYEPQSTISEMKVETEVGEYFLDNLDAIEERVAAHPETEFIMFFPPSSALWWDNEYRTGNLEVDLYMIQLLTERLSEYSNVKLFCYQNRTELVTDLNLYMDTVHFSQDINRLICSKVAADEGRLTLENVSDVTDEIREIVEAFSTEEILEYYPDATVN